MVPEADMQIGPDQQKVTYTVDELEREVALISHHQNQKDGHAEYEI